MRFELMNKDIKVAIVEVTNDLLTNLEAYTSLPNYTDNIIQWLNYRISPSVKQSINTLLKLANMDSKEEYLDIIHGISLTDTFWFKRENDKLHWSDVNPYIRNLSRPISILLLTGDYNGENIRIPSPDYKLDGSADKSWIRQHDKVYLYKTCGEKFSGITGNRPYCEYYANQVAKALISNKSHFVSYKISVSKTREGYKKAYSYCPIFTNEQYGYLPYGDSQFKDYTLDELDSILRTQRDREIIREMLILDALVLNYDRHNGNYGFLVNNDTYDIVGMAPIFDQDCSLGNFVSLQSVDTIEEAYNLALQKAPRTEMGDYIDQAKWALTSSLKQRIQNMYPFRFTSIKPELDIEPERLSFMEYIVNSQIKAILGN